MRRHDRKEVSQAVISTSSSDVVIGYRSANHRPERSRRKTDTWPLGRLHEAH